MTPRRLETATRGALFSLVLFAIAVHTFLLARAAVPTWALPTAALIGAGIACQTAHRRQDRADSAEDAPTRLQRNLVITLLATTLAMLVYGAVATGAREWDGATSWELRARVFALAPTFEQPFFLDSTVFAHTREYPPLQPMLLACIARIGVGLDLARLLFPLLWLLLLGLADCAWRRAEVRPRLRLGFLVALGLTPLLVDPTMGAVDSGFGELITLVAVTAAAGGLLHRDLAMTFCGALLLVLVKPEGLLYAPILVGVAWFSGRFGLLCAAVAGSALGLVLWLPSYLRLIGSATTPLDVSLHVGALAIPFLVSGAWIHLRQPRYRHRVIVVIAVVAIAGFGALGLTDDLGSPNGVLGVYFAGAERAAERLARLPEILIWFVQVAASPRKFGLLAALLLVLVCSARRAPCPSRPLLALVIAWFASLVTPFLLSPETDLRHHVSSTLDRLMLHHVGAAWLLIGIWWQPHPRTADAGATT